MTNQAKGYLFELPLPKHSQAGGVVLADHLGSLSWAGAIFGITFS